LPVAGDVLGASEACRDNQHCENRDTFHTVRPSSGEL
jgi:hypothetical protein